jgi:hypothetical protein
MVAPASGLEVLTQQKGDYGAFGNMVGEAWRWETACCRLLFFCLVQLAIGGAALAGNFCEVWFALRPRSERLPPETSRKVVPERSRKGASVRQSDRFILQTCCKRADYSKKSIDFPAKRSPAYIFLILDGIFYIAELLNKLSVTGGSFLTIKYFKNKHL